MWNNIKTETTDDLMSYIPTHEANRDRLLGLGLEARADAVQAHITKIKAEIAQRGEV